MFNKLKKRAKNKPIMWGYTIVAFAIPVIFIFMLFVLKISPVNEGIPWLIFMIIFTIYEGIAILITQFDSIFDYFRRNKVSIYLTLCSALFILMIKPYLFLNLNGLLKSLLASYIISILGAELRNGSLMTDIDFMLILLGGYMFFFLDDTNIIIQLSAYLTVLVGVYVFIDILIKIVTALKKRPDLIVNLFSLGVSLAALLFEITNI